MVPRDETGKVPNTPRSRHNRKELSKPALQNVFSSSVRQTIKYGSRMSILFSCTKFRRMKRLVWFCTINMLNLYRQCFAFLPADLFCCAEVPGQRMKKLLLSAVRDRVNCAGAAGSPRSPICHTDIITAAPPLAQPSGRVENLHCARAETGAPREREGRSALSCGFSNFWMRREQPRCGVLALLFINFNVLFVSLFVLTPTRKLGVHSTRG